MSVTVAPYTTSKWTQFPPMGQEAGPSSQLQLGVFCAGGGGGGAAAAGEEEGVVLWGQLAVSEDGPGDVSAVAVAPAGLAVAIDLDSALWESDPLQADMKVKLSF